MLGPVVAGRHALDSRDGAFSALIGELSRLGIQPDVSQEGWGEAIEITFLCRPVGYMSLLVSIFYQYITNYWSHITF